MAAILESEHYRVSEVARLVGLRYDTVLRHISEGRLKATPVPGGRIGRGVARYLVSPEAFEEYRRHVDVHVPARDYGGYVFTPEAAVLTGYPQATLREFIARGRLPAWRLDRGPTNANYLIELNELYRYMAKPKRSGRRARWPRRMEFVVPVSSVPVIPTIEGLPVQRVVPAERTAKEGSRKEQTAA